MAMMAIYAYSMALGITERATEAFTARLHGAREKGDIVSTLVLVGVFVIAAAAVGTILWKVLLTKANSVSNCVNSASACANSTP